MTCLLQLSGKRVKVLVPVESCRVIGPFGQGLRCGGSGRLSAETFESVSLSGLGANGLVVFGEKLQNQVCQAFMYLDPSQG